MTTNRRAPIATLGQVLAGGLPVRLASRLPGPALLKAWRELVGPTIAAKAWPVCLEPDGTLVVAVAGSSWRQEISLRAPELVQGLGERGQIVAGLRLVAARTPPPPPPEPPAPQPLEPADEQAIAAMLAGVSDPGLRQSLASLMRAQIMAQKSGAWDGD